MKCSSERKGRERREEGERGVGRGEGRGRVKK